MTVRNWNSKAKRENKKRKRIECPKHPNAIVDHDDYIIDGLPYRWCHECRGYFARRKQKGA